MISPADIDGEKTRIFLTHLSKAAKKVTSKEDSKKKIHEQVSKLKKASKSKQYREEIKKLEKHLSDVMQKENDIITHHKSRESFNKRVREKVTALEKKLTAYIEDKKKREKRIAELEEKIRKKFSVEQREIEILEKQILNIEAIYEKISSEKSHTKSELAAVKDKIELLKNRMAKIK